LFPLRDENPRSGGIPYATITLIILNLSAWMLIQGAGNQNMLAQSLCLYGLIPADLLGNFDPGMSIAITDQLACRFSESSNIKSLLTSMFLHGSWFHVLGNMWFLWVFGDNIEDIMGPFRFVIFYILCGLGAAATQISTDTSSIIPMVGASGAIGGVMGAYAFLFPRAKIYTLIVLGFFITTAAVPAILMLGYWFLIQLIQGLPALGSGQGGVAFWAHIGGFAAGVALIHLFKRKSLLAAHKAPAQRGASHSKLF